jgi:hypothetical protein
MLLAVAKTLCLGTFLTLFAFMVLLFTVLFREPGSNPQPYQRHACVLGVFTGFIGVIKISIELYKLWS